MDFPCFFCYNADIHPINQRNGGMQYARSWRTSWPGSRRPGRPRWSWRLRQRARRSRTRSWPRSQTPYERLAQAAAQTGLLRLFSPGTGSGCGPGCRADRFDPVTQKTSRLTREAALFCSPLRRKREKRDQRAAARLSTNWEAARAERPPRFRAKRSAWASSSLGSRSTPRSFARCRTMSR